MSYRSVRSCALPECDAPRLSPSAWLFAVGVRMISDAAASHVDTEFGAWVAGEAKKPFEQSEAITATEAEVGGTGRKRLGEGPGVVVHIAD